MRHLEIERPMGRARLERVPSGWLIDLDDVVDVDDATAVLTDALAAVADQGGGLARHWVRAGNPVTATASTRLGLVEERSLQQLRRPLPVDEPWSLDVRAFRVGEDEDAWLAVNNRAFAWHPEQGGWTRTELQDRMAEPWFDPAGFLLHEVEGRLVGFCWTKAHRDVEPNLGEIYVIAVDPEAEVHGLGRPLTLAGLDHLHRHDGMPIGMLYVDGGNDAARRLYDELGFTVHHTDVAYTITVAVP